MDEYCLNELCKNNVKNNADFNESLKKYKKKLVFDDSYSMSNMSNEYVKYSKCRKASDNEYPLESECGNITNKKELENERIKSRDAKINELKTQLKGELQLHKSRVEQRQKSKKNNIVPVHSLTEKEFDYLYEDVKDKIFVKIKNCFIEKGSLDMIPKPEIVRTKFNLEYLIRHYILSIPKDNDITTLRKIYNNLKQKYEIAPEVSEEILQTRRNNPHYSDNKQREIYDKFLIGRGGWFPSSGASALQMLGTEHIGDIQRNYTSSQGFIYDYHGAIEKIRDLLGCWILTIKLLVPNIDLVGGKKRKTRRSKMNKRRQRKTRKNQRRK